MAARVTPLPLVLRRLTVVRTGDPTPRMRRVTLGGPELGAFVRDGFELPEFTSLAFDDHVKLIFAPDGDIADALPEQRENGIEWHPSEVRVTRDYTPVHLDREAGEVSFDFVVHSARGEGCGPAEAWATTAQPGDDLWVVGPKSSTVLPATADWVLLVGDETALPAIERYLRDRPLEAPGRVVLAISDDAALPDLPTAAGDTVVTVIAEPGDPRALIGALSETSRPDGEGYVWAAAESRALLPVRRLASGEWGIPKNRINMTGYWHRQKEEAAPQTSSGAAARPPAGQLLPVLPQVVHSPVSWFAVRAALQSGLLASCEQDPATIDELAVRLGTTPQRLSPLVQILAGAEVLAVDDDRYRIGPAGELIVGDEHVSELFSGLWADQVLLLADLAESLGEPEPLWRRRNGRSVSETAAVDPEVYAELVERTERLTFLLPALQAVPELTGDTPITLVGPGAATLAGAFAESGRSTRVVEPSQAGADVLRSEIDDARVEISSTFAGAGPVLGALALDALEDDEAVACLRDLDGSAEPLILIEQTGTDALGPMAAQAALVRVAVAGGRPRTRDDLSAVAVAAGWRIAEARPLGWGVEALILVPARDA